MFSFSRIKVRKKEVPFSIAIGNCELMHEFSQTLLHGNSKNERRFNLIRWFLTATPATKPIIVSAGHAYNLKNQREKCGSTIQYGYTKWRTHARVVSQTLTHGNRKNEVRQ